MRSFRPVCLVCLSLASLASLLVAPRALACGTSGPDGVSACSLAEHDEAIRDKWRVSVSGVFTNTALHFGSTLRTDETRFATLVAVSYAPAARVALEVGLGGAFGGKLDAPDGPHEFSPGFVGAIGASWRVVDGKPFLVLSSQLSSTVSTTRHADAGPATGYEASICASRASSARRFGTDSAHTSLRGPSVAPSIGNTKDKRSPAPTCTITK